MAIDDGYMVIDAQALRKCGYPRWNMVIDAQALRKCGYPRWIYGIRCR